MIRGSPSLSNAMIEVQLQAASGGIGMQEADLALILADRYAVLLSPLFFY